GQPVLEGGGGGEGGGAAVVERGAQRASEVERAGAEGSAVGIAGALGGGAAGCARERLAAHGHQQLLARQAHRAVLAVKGQDGRLVGTGGDRAERHRRQRAAAQAQRR